MHTGCVHIPEVLMCFSESHSNVFKKTGLILMPNWYLGKHKAHSKKVEDFLRATQLVVAKLGPESWSSVCPVHFSGLVISLGA